VFGAMSVLLGDVSVVVVGAGVIVPLAAGAGWLGVTSGTVELVAAELSVLPVPVVPVALIEESFDIVPLAFVEPDISLLVLGAGVLPGLLTCC
jgi:hypothetical protein